MSFDLAKLKKVIETLKDDLGEGFVATDVWDPTDEKSVIFDHGYRNQPKAIALLSEVTRKLDKTLKGSEFPGLGNYYLVKLSNNQLVVVLTIGSYQQYLLVDLTKTTMGILMSIALPNLINGFTESTKHNPLSKLLNRPRGL